jgi:hypothetical protein
MAKIEICSSRDGIFLRATCEDGQRDITPSDPADLSDSADVVFAVEHDLVGGFGASVDWKSAEIIDHR